MSLWLEEKYLRLVSPQLDRYAQKHPHVFNFRCPLCGDSERVKSKARGFCYPKGEVLLYKCHNCSVALPFMALLRRLSPRLYDEYLLESLKEKGQTRHEPEPLLETVRLPKASFGRTPSMLLRRLDRVSPTDAVRAYVEGRKVPVDYLPRLWGTTQCQAWLTPLVGEEKAAKVIDDKEYLVFPLTLPNGDWFGAQVRALDGKIYVTFRWEQEPLKVFGLDCWTPMKTTYIVEGPMDALFVPNGIAACGSDLLGVIRILVDKQLMAPKDPVVYVWDNEPRNHEVMRHLRTAIRLHESVVVWPRGYPKDVNDMIKAGLDPVTVIAKRTFKGLSAELEFASWAK